MESWGDCIRNTIDYLMSIPPPNYGVGTSDEQTDRFLKFCAKYGHCDECPIVHHKKNGERLFCFVEWMHMKYEGEED